MKLVQLERELEKLEGFGDPTATLEQYQTPSTVAARLLFHASMRGDITGKRVCDLGCGTGILSCGAILLGAVAVLGVDVDPLPIEIARRNAARIGRTIDFLVTNISSDQAFEGYTCDTVVMNPPFGAQQRHADRPFIDRALKIGSVIYGVFNAGSRSFIEPYTERRATVEEVVHATFPIKRTFAFHRRETQEIDIEIIRLKRHL